MLANSEFAEEIQVVEGFLPIDMSLGANDGDWVSLKNYNRLTIVLFKDVGTAAQDPIITLEQAQAVAGTGAKALAAIDRVHTKQAAVNLQAVGQYSLVEQAAAATYTDAALGEEAAIIVIDIRPADLDLDNGFDCVRARVADTGAGAGAMGALLYFLSGARNGQGDNLPSAIVD